MTTQTAPSGQPMQEFEKVLDSADKQVASFDGRRGVLDRVQHALHANPTLVPILVLTVSLVVFKVLLGDKLGLATLGVILQQTAIVGIIGVAQTLVVITAGIDLSVGAIMVLSTVVMGQFTMRYGIPAPISLLCGFAAGALCGWINGALVAYVRLPPFIVTLGTWSIFAATYLIYSANETIRSQDIARDASILQFLGRPINIGGVTIIYGVIFMVLLVAIFWYILNHTAWGRYVYAIGDDPDAARLSGIRLSKTLMSVYVVAGFICALAGWALIGRLGSISPQSGQQANIDAITAVVIGGTSLFGGRGSVVGTLFGALIVNVFAMGLRVYGTDVQWTYLTVGALIIAAVAVDQWIRKVSG